MHVRFKMNSHGTENLNPSVYINEEDDIESSDTNQLLRNEVVHSDENDNEGSGTYDEVFKAVGFGWWHFLLLVQCGWANASDAIEIMCISFTMAEIHTSLSLSSNDVAWLTYVLFLGMMIGGYLWGSLADSWGRRRVVIYSLTINGLFGAFSAVSQSYWVLLLMRFISGIGAGGSLPVCFTYFSEFQPNERRGAMLSALATSWMLGNVIAAGLAWLVLPASMNLAPYSPNQEPWRLFIIICAIPSLSSAVFFFFMPESPKFLMFKGRTNKALEVLRNIYNLNHRKKNQHFPYRRITVEDDDLPSVSSRSGSRRGSQQYESGFTRILLCLRPVRCFRFFASIGRNIVLQVKTVFGPTKKSKRNTLSLVVVYFCIAFGGYGITMWLPTLMDRVERYEGPPCQALNTSIPAHNHTNGSDTDAFRDVFIGAAAQLPANILTILIVDRVGGKRLLIFGMITSGLSVLFFWLVQSKIQVIIMSAVFNAVSTFAWNGIDVVTPEMYETSVRSSASGFLTAFSRVASILGNVLFGIFIDSNCSIPILTVTAVFLLGGVASLLLPNTKNITLA